MTSAATSPKSAAVSAGKSNGHLLFTPRLLSILNKRDMLICWRQAPESLPCPLQFGNTGGHLCLSWSLGLNLQPFPAGASHTTPSTKFGAFWTRYISAVVAPM